MKLFRLPSKKEAQKRRILFSKMGIVAASQQSKLQSTWLSADVDLDLSAGIL
jgi:hypothetical protein